ncbi:MAG: DUF3788 family protein [Thermoanaerobaculia bacterium]
MALSAFDDKTRPPEPPAVDRVLGRSACHWHALIDHVTAGNRRVTPLWHFAGSRFGWSFRLKQDDRILLYLIPQQGHFLASIVLGEKAVHAAQACHDSEDLLALIEAAPRYAEGRGIRLQVSTGKHVKAVEQLLAFKVAS